MADQGAVAGQVGPTGQRPISDVGITQQTSIERLWGIHIKKAAPGVAKHLRANMEVCQVSSNTLSTCKTPLSLMLSAIYIISNLTGCYRMFQFLSLCAEP